ncbi:Synaptotagmin-9 [Halotydeus destructor]|nr:Synaptotagmin-9 [Halotydeus destructor]
MTKKKGSLGPESPPFVSNVQPEPGNVRISFKLEQAEEDSSVKLLICLHEAHGLKSRDYGLEPASYLGLELFMMNGTRMSRRRTAHNKVLASFRTTSSKRTVNPMFDESFSTANISKAILKNGLLRIRLMDDERHANDVCIGELNLTIKDLVGCQDVHRKSYPLSSPKDFKADLLFGYCYLPTSQRVTITILKANLPSNVAAGVRNYYVRVLMFINGKMNKKKKTPTSEKLTWSDCETLTFELGPVANNLYHEQVTFMLVLSWSSDANVVSASSPSSPETPEAQDGTGSRKDRHIGCYVMGTVCWTEMMAEPRRQFTKWAKLL